MHNAILNRNVPFFIGEALSREAPISQRLYRLQAINCCYIFFIATYAS